MKLQHNFLLFSCFLSLVNSEPKCSRFEYEEKLLEKMVRLEFDVNQMLKETQKLAVTVNKEISKIRKDAEDVESRVATGLTNLDTDRVELKENLNKDRVELKENVSSAIDLIKQFSTELKDSMELYRNTTTTRLEEVSTTPLVAFRATNVADTSPATDQVIVYRSVRQNDGNGYDSATGIFTAPVAGLYLFSVQSRQYVGKYFQFAIVKEDGTVLVYSQAFDDSGTPTTSSTTVVYLNVGEKVWVKCRGGSSSAFLHSSSYNQFLGILIHK